MSKVTKPEGAAAERAADLGRAGSLLRNGRWGCGGVGGGEAGGGGGGGDEKRACALGLVVAFEGTPCKLEGQTGKTLLSGKRWSTTDFALGKPIGCAKLSEGNPSALLFAVKQLLGSHPWGGERVPHVGWIHILTSSI